jgi:hypothetical protein
MSAAQLKRIALALAVAVFLWGLVEILGRRGDTISETPLLPALSPAEVDAITIAGDADTIVLERVADSTWTVNGFDASPDAVGTLLGALAEPTAGELIAQNPSSHERMGVDTSSAKRLTIGRGEQVLGEVLVGAQGRSFRSAYARKPGDDDVFLVEGELIPLLDRNVTDWRDKRIVTLEPDSIHGITVERGGTRYSLVRADGTWSFDDGAPVDSARMARLVEAFARVEAQGAAFAAPEEASAADFDRPDRRVHVMGPSRSELVALAFDSTDTGFWVRRTGGETIYQLNRWRVDDLTPADSSLRQRE